MLEAIHRERRMSLDHWRYRLLHWALGDREKLPNYLYTHYCPLFHLTNMIAVFLPFVVVLKVFCALLRVAIAGVRASVGAVEVRAGAVRQTKRRRRESISYITGLVERDPDLRQFSVFAEECGRDWPGIEADELESIHAAIVARLERSRNEAKKKASARLSLVVNLSSLLFRCGFNLLYIVAAGGVAYSLFLLAQMFAHLWVLDWMPWLIIAGKAGLVGGSILAVCFAGVRYKWFRNCIEIVCDTAVAATPPLAVAWGVFSAPARWGLGVADCVAAFVSEFYQDNCPPITIVSSHEEEVEQSA